MGKCPSGRELSCHGEVDIVLVGRCPSGESSCWGVVLEGSCPAGESSGWELSSGELSYNRLSAVCPA